MNASADCQGAEEKTVMLSMAVFFSYQAF